MYNMWVDHTIELRQDVNMLRACIKPIPSSSLSESDMDISDGCSSNSGQSGGELDSGWAPSWQVSKSSNG